MRLALAILILTVAAPAQDWDTPPQWWLDLDERRATERADGVRPPERRLIVPDFWCFHGTAGSKVFHQRGCRHYRAAKVILFSREQALELGYRPCELCRP